MIDIRRTKENRATYSAIFSRIHIYSKVTNKGVT